MRPAAITLNYSVKDIRHDVQQIIYIIHIRIWKIAIEQTSVGLTHACPNYCKFMYICVRNWDNYELCICDVRYIAIGKDRNKTSGRGCSGHWGRGTSQLIVTSLQISLAAICLVSVWLELVSVIGPMMSDLQFSQTGMSWNYGIVHWCVHISDTDLRECCLLSQRT